jgi:hypothetical protein
MTRFKLRYALLAGAFVALGACGEKSLVVQNPNNADTKRVLATPSDVENLLGSYYKRYMSGLYTSTTNVWGMAAVQSFEDYSTLSNNCMGQRIPIPRPANDNTLGNPCGPEQQKVYSRESEVEHVASTVIAQIQGGLTLGSVAQDQRAIAFAQFERGLSLGYLAMIYDSSAIVTPAMMAANPTDPGVLVDYNAVMTASLDAMDSAIVSTNAGSASFPLPSTWIPSSTTFGAAEFIKLIRSYKARFRAGVARTPTERAAVDWSKVIADAQNGITADHDNITSLTTGPNMDWTAQWYSYGTWHQMTPFVIGMADTSGAYDAWIKQPLATRGSGGPFFMVTPDLRFPQGTTRAAQQADFALSQCTAAATVCTRYFVNRPKDNPAAQAWGASNYDHARFWSWAQKGDNGSAQNGKFPFFTKAELDMLQAEGLIRTNQGAAAAALINKTRTRNGLPAISAVITAAVPGGTAAAPVPGGTSCVPRVPDPAPAQGAASPGTHCGDMMEAMKYEKRIEEAYTNFADWFIDMRGWGDLPQGTGLHWAVPYQDLQVRGHPNYSAGGGLPGSSAGLGTYGW